jgi:hypothetical protein
MHGASDPWKVSMEPSQAIAMIEVPPAPGGDVIIERRGAATFGTSEGGVASMDDPDVDAKLPGVECKELDPPRILQAQEF